MDVHVGADHGGFTLKEKVRTELAERGYTVHDHGAFAMDPTDDYPSFAAAVATAVAADPAARGILFCRSGQGMSMAANRFPGVRAALVWSAAVTVHARQHNDANVLVLGADDLDQSTVEQCLTAFLETARSSDERHLRRINQLDHLSNTSPL